MNKDNRIGIISPSNNLITYYPNRNKQGIKNMKEIGFEVIFAHNAYRVNNYTKESIKERIDEINQLMDENIQLLLASIGGYLSIQLLDSINYNKMCEKKITICGSSDITAILLAAYVKTNMIMLYGPTYTVNFCDYEGISDYIKDSFINCFLRQDFSYTYSPYCVDEFIDWKELELSPRGKHISKKNNDWKIINKGSCFGKLIGGNLSTMLLILGTEYLPIDIFKDKILFIEDCETNINEFCSYLECLRLNGVFDMVNGIIFGKFDTNDMNNQIEKLLHDYFSNYQFPIICNLDFGHINPMFTIPIGANAEIICDDLIHFNIKFDKEDI